MDKKIEDIPVGDSKYRMYTYDKKKRGLHGRINFALKSIAIYAKGLDEDTVEETVLHELIHAVLKEMNHAQYKDESFVTPFAYLLNKALRSRGKYHV